MTTRYDVFTVLPQGGYVAKRCPVRAQNDTIRPAEPLPDGPVLERRFQRGIDLEADVFSELERLHTAAVRIPRGEATTRESETVDAMRAGTPLILAGRLPVDLAARRAGEPDVLVAAKGGGYRAIDVKHHGTLVVRGPRDAAALIADLVDPAREGAVEDPAWTGHKRRSDLLQLAHYQRMLEAAGFAALGGRHGSIVGTERRAVWFDLDAPMWRTPSASETQKLRSTMDVYDFEFDFRLDVIAVALQHLADPSVEPLLVPVRISECGECPWREHCRAQLEVGSGDVSLIPRVGWREWKMHHDLGVFDRAGIAALDMCTAQLRTAKVDVADLLARCAGLPSETPLREVDGLAGRAAQLRTLGRVGMTTVGDTVTLSRETAAYPTLASLPEQIDQARAALGPAPVYRRRGVDALVVPRGDVEVDVDMENVEDGVYLWGALLSEGGEQRYQAFATWLPLDAAEQARNFRSFWDWLLAVRSGALGSGKTFRAYCYSAIAENRFLRECGATLGVLDGVEDFIASDEWVDMLKVFDSQLITGGPIGLKAVAPLAGFAWNVEDPGGAGSMLRYDDAVVAGSPETRAKAREWLLEYNRGDVEATLAIREWMQAAALPSIESLDPTA